jgi:hypothetical protein
MDSGGVSSEVIIETVSPELRKEAKAAGISTGRVLLQKKALENNLLVSDAEIGTMNLNKIEKEKKLSIVGLLGEDSGNNTKVYNLDKGEGSGAVEQGIYAERNNANIKIKSKTESIQGSENNNYGNNQNNNNSNNSMNQNNSKK